MESLIDLPKLPLTEMYEPWTAEFEPGRGVEDQTFLFCAPCTHGKLETIIPPAVLYGPGYRTRTAASGGAFQAVHRFSEFVRNGVDLQQIDTVIDVGGNDASLVQEFPLKKRVVVDPNATGSATRLIKSFIEDADLSEFKGDRKLILSSHTIEHLQHPDGMLKKLAGITGYQDTLALQFPSLDLLVEDARIDHIHHQHVHYFSLRSIGLLLARHGLEIVRYQFDHAHYGALMLICRRGLGPVAPATITSERISFAVYNFGSALHSCAVALEERSLVGFGAALMLPVLAYHLPELDGCEYIADNDRLKHGLRYINFNKRVEAGYSLRDRDVVITAIATKQAARLLMIQAFEKGARNVFLPLHGL